MFGLKIKISDDIREVASRTKKELTDKIKGKTFKEHLFTLNKKLKKNIKNKPLEFSVGVMVLILGIVCITYFSLF